MKPLLIPTNTKSISKSKSPSLFERRKDKSQTTCFNNEEEFSRKKSLGVDNSLNLSNLPRKDSKKKISNASTHISTADVYLLSSQLDKVMKKSEGLLDLECKTPFKYVKGDSTKMLHLLNSIQDKKVRKMSADSPQPSHGQKKEENYEITVSYLEYHKPQSAEIPTLILNEPEPTIPANRFQQLLEVVKEHYEFDLSEIKEYSFNASSILRNTLTNGVLILGSNNYKYKLENLNELDVVVNVIGEYPEKEFSAYSNVSIKVFGDSVFKDVCESIVILENKHCVNFFTLPKEMFSTYHYLSELIHKYIWSGKRVLVHCQMGQIRSATFLVYYLRRYFFKSVVDANEFIGFKRKGAGAPEIFMTSIERMVKEKDL